MDRFHGVRELEHEGVGTWVCNNLKWSKIVVREVLGGVHVQKYLAFI